jgi:hypothetical protein
MKNHLTTLFIVRMDGTKGTFISNDAVPAIQHNQEERGVQKLESGVLDGSEKGKWLIAYVYFAHTPPGTAPLHAYYHSTGIQRMTKEEAEYMRMFNSPTKKEYKAYIIPTSEQQAKGQKPKTEWIENPEAAAQFLNKNVWKVLVYLGDNKLPIKTFLAVV